MKYLESTRSYLITLSVTFLHNENPVYVLACEHFVGDP